MSGWSLSALSKPAIDALCNGGNCLLEPLDGQLFLRILDVFVGRIVFLVLTSLSILEDSSAIGRGNAFLYMEGDGSR